MKNKKVKKSVIVTSIILVILVSILIFVSLYRKENKSIKTLTVDYIKSYIKLDKEVLKDIKYPFDEKTTPEEERRYKEIVKGQYRNLEYTINEIKDDGVSGMVTVNFMVKDLKSSYDKSISYIGLHEDKFMTKKEFDNYKAVDYILDEMEQSTEKVDYTVTFNFYKKKGKWVMEELSSYDLSKINGTY